MSCNNGVRGIKIKAGETWQFEFKLTATCRMRPLMGDEIYIVVKDGKLCFGGTFATEWEARAFMADSIDRTLDDDGINAELARYQIFRCHSFEEIPVTE